MKKIRERRDLAIHGAPPAFAAPLHVGRPNIGDREAFLSLVSEILERRWLTNNGPLVRRLEERIAALHGVRHCVAMCNGTIALEIAIRALGLKGEVIVPSFTFIATAHALHWQEIVPVFADIRGDTHTLDPDAVESMITPRTSGIIGVHTWGRCCDVEGLQAVADRHGLRLLFDAAHAFGCAYGGTRVGNFGACEVLSFHATKFFNTFEGGAVLTNDDALAEQMRLMRNFGFAGLDNVIHPGTNGKMTEVAAAMGLVNLDAVDGIVQANRRNHTLYKALLDPLPGVRVLDYDPAQDPNYQYVVAEIGRDCPVGRDRLLEALRAENVLARRYFWPGCHRMQPYRDLYPHAGLLLPVTERIAGEVLVLPTGTGLPEQDIRTLCAVVSTVVGASV